MKVSDRLQQKICAQLNPVHIDISNESHMHAGPATDSHFKLVIVAAAFDALSRVKRHQKIYSILQDELQGSVPGSAGSIHALALHLFTPAEWEHSKVPASPLCAGKNK